MGLSFRGGARLDRDRGHAGLAETLRNGDEPLHHGKLTLLRNVFVGKVPAPGVVLVAPADRSIPE